MTLDELLLEWSYRSEKGYPELDNPSDISILKQILEKLDIPTHAVIQNLKEKKLTTSDLTKTTKRGDTPDRADLILAKIDKQNFINMNYQNENDNGFNSTLSKLNDILELLQKSDK